METMEKLKQLTDSKQAIALVKDYLRYQALAKLLKDEYYNIVEPPIWEKHKVNFPVDVMLERDHFCLLGSDGYLKTSEYIWMIEDFNPCCPLYLAFEKECADVVVKKYGDKYLGGYLPHLVLNNQSIDVRHKINNLVLETLVITKSQCRYSDQEKFFNLFLSAVTKRHNISFNSKNLMKNFLKGE